jgi:hypothetical protein
VDTTILKDRENKKEKKAQKMRLKETEIVDRLRLDTNKIDNVKFTTISKLLFSKPEVNDKDAPQNENK